jgi:hypothetical protein
MEDQIPSSVPPQSQELGYELPPDFLEQLKARARDEAVRQTILQQQAAQAAQAEAPAPKPSVPSAPITFAPPQPSVVYVRRNLTVAELIVVFAIACGLVTGVQATWNFASNVLPRIEIKAR